MKAIILAGGKATRLYPVTLYMPKQLIMISGHPAIHYIFNHCKKAGIEDFILCISDNEMKDHFMNALGDGSHIGINIEYSIDSEKTGTSGRVLSAAERFLDQKEKNFLAYYGDIISDFDLRRMINTHLKTQDACTIAISSSKILEFGICNVSGDKRVVNFKERPTISEISDVLVNCGIAVCNKQVLKYCRKEDDFFGDTIPKILKNDHIVNAFDIKTEFYDIGSYSAIEKILINLKASSTPSELSEMRSIKRSQRKIK